MPRFMSSGIPALRPPIFVGGTGRSGTTVFARLLGTHPQIFSLRWESQFIVAKHGLIDVVDSGFEEAKVAKFLELLRGRWYRRTLNEGKPNEYVAGLAADVSEANLERIISDFESRVHRGGNGPDAARGLVAGLFEAPAAAAGAGRWCEKTPRNSLYMDRIAAMFPEARFINVLRDGRDVACSMVERGFWPIGATHDFPSTNPFRGEVTFAKAISYWVEMVRLAREVARALPAESYMEVRLEDLVFEQEQTVRRVLEFLDEPLVDSLLRFDMRADAIGRWKEDLSTEDAALAEELAGPELAREGYEV